MVYWSIHFRCLFSFYILSNCYSQFIIFIFLFCDANKGPRDWTVQTTAMEKSSSEYLAYFCLLNQEFVLNRHPFCFSFLRDERMQRVKGTDTLAACLRSHFFQFQFQWWNLGDTTVQPCFQWHCGKFLSAWRTQPEKETRWADKSVENTI